MARRDVEVWRDIHDRVTAYGYVEEGFHWMHFPRLGSYRFGKTGNEITAFPCTTAKPVAVRDVYRRSVLPMVMQVHGREVLHASAIVVRDRSIAFCGLSGAGKSTIAYGLARRGYHQWADDSVALERVRGRIQTVALPFAVRLRPDPARYFGKPSKYAPGPSVMSHRPPRAGTIGLPLSTLFILEQAPSHRMKPAVSIRRLSAAEFFTGVLPHAYCFNLSDPARKRLMIRRYLEIGSRADTFELRFTSDLRNLPLVLDRIEDVIRAG